MKERYPLGAIALHWLTAAILVFQVALGLRLGDPAPFDGLRLHQTLGIAVLLLTVLRIAWRLTHRVPPAPAAHAVWERGLASGVHVAFYALMLALPLSGWLWSSSTGAQEMLRLYGLLWPKVPGAAGSESVELFAQRTHEWLVWAGYALVALHVAGALKHHLSREASVLPRMLPGVSRLLDWRLAVVASVAGVLVLAGSGAIESSFGLGKKPGATRIDPRRTPVFRGLIEPILAARCAGCHGENKQKGGLRLDGFAHVMKGGEGGVALAAGNAVGSELFKRILLPRDHKKAMPPRDREPLSFVEGELLRWWIDAGADEGMTIAAAPGSALVDRILEGLGADPASNWLVYDVPPAPAADIEKARERGFRVQPVARDSALLDVALVPGAAPQGQLQTATLLPLAGQIVWLDLSRAQLPSSSWADLGKLKILNRLNLTASNVTDESLVALAGSLGELQSLNLYGTAVTDRGLEALTRAPALSTVYVAGTAVSNDGMERLKKARPQLRVIGPQRR